mmetsp:Transcript_62305/g.184347  ORF Transcript_62305/g.184347 Transcript_62305/m.184347 type:complete len:196 (-) Transcript_62305:999-1586(-)
MKSSQKKTTSGVGGAWSKNSTAIAQTRRPSRGSWGYFERPNDISKAYGGGRRVGELDKEKMERSAEETRRKLQAYRQKVGIEVQSEKDHAAEIDDALALGQRAMEVRDCTNQITFVFGGKSVLILIVLGDFSFHLSVGCTERLFPHWKRSQSIAHQILRLGARYSWSSLWHTRRWEGRMRLLLCTQNSRLAVSRK